MCIMFPSIFSFMSVLFLIIGDFDTVTGCGFDKCAAVYDDAINVHMVSHSHDDVGWVKTVNQYYNGQVRSILDTVVNALLAKPERKFIQVETAFLHMWWTQQSKQRKDQVRHLVRNGQLEIAGGAWSMNDEATAHYHSIIDSFTLGLRFINDTLGPCGAPKVGWQIDPFGHSKQMASLLAEFGFKALFFGRIDYRDKAKRIKENNMEIIWRGHLTLGNESDIFTSTLYNLYQPPEGFCFDNVCGNTIGAYNEDTKVRQFVRYIDEMTKAYKTNNLLITMGGDFTYTLADIYFGQIDYLMEAIRKRKMRSVDGRVINIFYSTPACYYKAVRDTLVEFKTKTDDFFPYADKLNAYWTGFYTSRPTSKRYEREGNNLLQVSKQLAVLSGVGSNGDLFELSSAMGIMQHHDAITGTEKQFVAADYSRLMHKAMQHAIKENTPRIKRLYNVDHETNRDFVTCSLANMSICSLGSSKHFALILYNPLAYTISQHVRLPVAHHKYVIKTSFMDEVPYQISTPLRLFSGDGLPFELTFLAENIPALGMKQFLITVAENSDSPSSWLQAGEYHELGTKDLGLVVDTECKIMSLFNANHSIEFGQKLMYYDSRIVPMRFSKGRPSGAYIFSPQGRAKSFPDMNCTLTSGPVYDEIRQVYNNWAGQIVRIYKDKKYVEFDWTVGKIHLEKFQGKEIISRFTTNLNSGDFFRTDTNGRSYITRQRNHRPSYDFDSDGDEIAGNYYPLTTYIGIDDLPNNKHFNVFTDRAQGGTSLKSGEVEIMLHRRLVQDDMLGVEEVLNEQDTFMGAVARGQHIITFGSLNEREDETISRELLLKPWTFLVPVDINEATNVWKLIEGDYFGMTRDFPKDVHLLTLEPWKKWEDKILIRFEHINERGFPILLDLKNLFMDFKIVDLKETTLGGNVWKQEERIRHRSTHRSVFRNGQQMDLLQVYLKPLQIRTFVATIKYFV